MAVSVHEPAAHGGRAKRQPLGPMGMARRVRGSRRRPVRRLPADVQDLSRYRGRRGPGAAGVGHAARELAAARLDHRGRDVLQDRKSTRLNSSHMSISYAVFCLKKKMVATAWLVYLL